MSDLPRIAWIAGYLDSSFIEVNGGDRGVVEISKGSTRQNRVLVHNASGPMHSIPERDGVEKVLVGRRCYFPRIMIETSSPELQ
jgi:hypothetical protein